LAASIEFPPRLGQYVASRDRDRLDATLMASIGHVHGVLHEYRRVVVGERDTSAIELTRGGGEILRGRSIGERVDLPGVGDVPVLAKLAGEIAPCGSEGQHRRARQKVIQRLLLHRIDAEPT
jgi:hypothetical protein